MKAVIEKSKATGVAYAPPSKSVSHRALICGALSEGSEISGLAMSKDIEATLNCLKALGASANNEKGALHIGGLNPESVSETELFCNESGSTLRFLIPLCLLCGKKVVLKGSQRLLERPLGIYKDICQAQNILFEQSETSLTLCGRLKSGSFDIPGDISSQFISGLLFALPLLEGESKINIIGPFESASYVDITLDILSTFGIKVFRRGSTFTVPGNQRYQSRKLAVEGDCSNAAFLEALNFIGGNAKIENVPENTLQGDIVYRDIFKGLSSGITQFDLSDCPDLAPVLFAMAAYKGHAVFTGTKRLKIKESDRALVMACELSKLGAELIIGENSVTVNCKSLKAPAEPLCGHNDHRVVMSLAVLLTLTGGEIEGAEAVSKSYPDFFKVLKNLNIGVSLYEA